MTNEQASQRVKEERNILRTVDRRKVNCIGEIFHRNCFLKQVTEGNVQERIETTGRRERRRKQLLDDPKAGVPKLFDSRSPF